MAEMINIVIDDVPCTCEKGEYIWDVAARNGIRIPALCRSDAFPEHRACCRVCIVEVEIRGKAKVVTSCVYPVEEECIVRTNSDLIARERAMIMAFLACRAPESEEIAARAQRMGKGMDFSRFLKLDSGKCILCGLCVQACDSLGAGAISTVNRGVEKEVNTPYGAFSDDCLGCASCANVCPTGAIEYEETPDTRTIWNREFELVHCAVCGTVLGTAESVSHAKGLEVSQLTEDELVCDACRKRRVADSMMSTYCRV